MSRDALLATVARVPWPSPPRVPLPSPPRVLALCREQGGRLVHVCDVEVPASGQIALTGLEPSATYRFMPSGQGVPG